MPKPVDFLLRPEYAIVDALAQRIGPSVYAVSDDEWKSLMTVEAHIRGRGLLHHVPLRAASARCSALHP